MLPLILLFKPNGQKSPAAAGTSEFKEAAIRCRVDLVVLLIVLFCHCHRQYFVNQES
jgi:hypothetical protein